MNAQNFRYVLAGLIGLVLISVGVVIYYGVNMLQTEVNKTQKVKADAEVNARAEFLAQQAQIELQKPEVAKLSKYLDKVIPENSYKNQFIADVNSYAAEAGVPLNSLTYLEEEGVSVESISGAEPVPIQLQVGTEISYKKFISFVKKLENNLQHVQIVSISLQPNAENRAILQSAALSVVLYVEPKDGQ